MQIFILEISQINISANSSLSSPEGLFYLYIRYLLKKSQKKLIIFKKKYHLFQKKD